MKTAAQLINEYGDLDTLLARAGEIKQPKRRETLTDPESVGADPRLEAARLARARRAARSAARRSRSACSRTARRSSPSSRRWNSRPSPSAPPRLYGDRRGARSSPIRLSSARAGWRGRNGETLAEAPRTPAARAAAGGRPSATPAMASRAKAVIATGPASSPTPAPRGARDENSTPRPMRPCSSFEQLDRMDRRRVRSRRRSRSTRKRRRSIRCRRARRHLAVRRAGTRLLHSAAATASDGDGDLFGGADLAARPIAAGATCSRAEAAARGRERSQDRAEHEIRSGSFSRARHRGRADRRHDADLLCARRGPQRSRHGRAERKNILAISQSHLRRGRRLGPHLHRLRARRASTRRPNIRPRTRMSRCVCGACLKPRLARRAHDQCL